jgi:hypothetical protein
MVNCCQSIINVTIMWIKYMLFLVIVLDKLAVVLNIYILLFISIIFI